MDYRGFFYFVHREIYWKCCSWSRTLHFLPVHLIKQRCLLCNRKEHDDNSINSTTLQFNDFDNLWLQFNNVYDWGIERKKKKTILEILIESWKKYDIVLNYSHSLFFFLSYRNIIDIDIVSDKINNNKALPDAIFINLIKIAYLRNCQ